MWQEKLPDINDENLYNCMTARRLEQLNALNCGKICSFLELGETNEL
jgi:hypothetical protein